MTRAPMGIILEDPMTRRAAREQSLEGVPESSGWVPFIPDCRGQRQEKGHTSNSLSWRRPAIRGGMCGLPPYLLP